MPVEAIHLAEDIYRLETLLGLLNKIEPRNITKSDTQEQRDFGDDMLRNSIVIARSWHRVAKRKLAKYLAP